MHGFAEVQAICYKNKKVPLCLAFEREQDCQWKPFELHLASVYKWGPGLQMALTTGRTIIPADAEEDRGRRGRGEYRGGPPGYDRGGWGAGSSGSQYTGGWGSGGAEAHGQLYVS